MIKTGQTNKHNTQFILLHVVIDNKKIKISKFINKLVS